MEEKLEHKTDQRRAPVLVDRQQQQNTPGASIMPETPPDKVLSAGQRLTALDLYYFSNGDRRNRQRLDPRSIGIDEQQFSTLGAADEPAVRTNRARESDRDKCVDNSNMTSLRDTGRAENEIPRLRFPKIHWQVPPNSRKDNYKDSAFLTTAGADSTFASSRHSTTETVSPVSPCLEASSGVLKPRTNKAKLQNSLGNLRAVSASFRKKIEDPQIQPKSTLGRSLKPISKRYRAHASGTTGQAGCSQKTERPLSSRSANMDRSASRLSTDPNSEPNQSQGVSLEPGDLPSTSGRSLNLSNEIHHPATKSFSQSEQDSNASFNVKHLPPLEPRIVVAISGGPSSGKSTLAYLLAAVFEATTITDTGFAGAQSIYPVYDATVVENPGRKGPIAKVVVIDQGRYMKDLDDLPIVEWTELDPYSPAIEIMKPKIGLERALADIRGVREWDRYWEESYNINVGIEPERVSLPSGSRLHEVALPKPVRVSKASPNIDCRGAIAWDKFSDAIRDGMTGRMPVGIMETEQGRDKIEAYLAQPCPKSHVPLVDSEKIEPLRERIRNWIQKEKEANENVGFAGRAIVDGSLKPICIIDGPLLFLPTDPVKGAGNEKLMDTCNVKLFLPTLETEAIQRSFSRREYMDPPEGIREPGRPWMYEGYFCEVAWPEYVSEHSWLFENQDITSRDIVTSSPAFSHEIHVRDFYSANLEERGHKYEGKRWSDETLDWAVRTILFQLSMDEAVARREWDKWTEE